MARFAETVRGVVAIDGKVLRRRPLYLGGIAPSTAHSDAMSKDLKRRGLLDDTLVVWGGEFENQQRAMARFAIVVPITIATNRMIASDTLPISRSARLRVSQSSP